jgi:hypothetical protein
VRLPGSTRKAARQCSTRQIYLQIHLKIIGFDLSLRLTSFPCFASSDVGSAEVEHEIRAV